MCSHKNLLWWTDIISYEGINYLLSLLSAPIHSSHYTGSTLVQRLHNVQLRPWLLYAAPVLLSGTRRAEGTNQMSNIVRCPLLLPVAYQHRMHIFLALTIISFAALIMASQNATVTRIACFRFKENVTAEQKGDRARAFLNLYAQHQDLILGMPKGGKPLNTPLNLTNVKRDSVWDTGFTVTFKVG